MAERLMGRPDHIAFGAANVSENGAPQIQRCEQRKELFHRQNRHRQLNHVGAPAGQGKIGLATIDNPELDRKLSRPRIKIDADHFTAQAAFAHALGKRAANQPEPHDHQPPDQRPGRLL
ncbi:hypothetical protein TOC8171_29350 [Pseudomonas syringae]